MRNSGSVRSATYFRNIFAACRYHLLHTTTSTKHTSRKDQGENEQHNGRRRFHEPPLVRPVPRFLLVRGEYLCSWSWNNRRRNRYCQPEECAGRHLADGDRPDIGRMGVVDPVGLGALAKEEDPHLGLGLGLVDVDDCPVSVLEEVLLTVVERMSVFVSWCVLSPQCVARAEQTLCSNDR